MTSQRLRPPWRGKPPRVLSGPVRTAADLRAWMERRFPGWGGIARAARELGIHRTTLERKLRGELPITARDERQIGAIEKEGQGR